MPALDWTHTIGEVPETGLQVAREADSQERAALAREFGVLQCSAVRARYALRRVGADRFALDGQIEARLTQACVVTLEPVEQMIAEPLAAEFAPSEVAENEGKGEADLELDIEALETPLECEPIVAGRLDVGRVVYEHIAAALDPYPRKEGAVFDWRDPKDEATGTGSGPFAALAKLKQPK